MLTASSLCLFFRYPAGRSADTMRSRLPGNLYVLSEQRWESSAVYLDSYDIWRHLLCCFINLRYLCTKHINKNVISIRQ